MIEQAFSDVVEFHEKFDLRYDGKTRMLSIDLANFRVRFLHEEAKELRLAISREMQLDALIDETYVALGTLYLHVGKYHAVEFPHLAGRFGSPRQLGSVDNITDALVSAIDAYVLADNVEAKCNLLVSIAHTCALNACLAGWDFNEGWRRVHAANMKKVRATVAEQSARGSIFDVVKPVGWRPAPLFDLV